MTEPHSSTRYAVIRGTLIGAPVGTMYSVVAVHGINLEGDRRAILVSQMMVGSPVSFSPPQYVASNTVVAMLRNSADATVYAKRLREEDREAEEANR